MHTPIRYLVLFLLAIAVCVSPSVAQSLRYASEKGQIFTYDFDIEVENPSLTTKYTGSTTYVVDSLDDQQLSLTYQGGLVESVKRKDSSTGFPAFPSVSIPRIPIGGPFGETKFKGRTQTTNQITMSRLGKVIEMGGDSQLPFLLGNLSLLPFEPLPEEGDESWTAGLGVRVDSTSESSRSRFGFAAPLGPFADRETKTIQPASEVASYVREKKVDALMVFKKTYKISTPENRDMTAIEMTGEGKWTFNLTDHLPEALEMRLKLQHKEENVAVTYPIKLSYKRVAPEVVALRAAEVKQKAIEAKELAERPITAAEKQELLNGLASANPLDIKTALDRLAAKSNVRPDPDFAKAVETLLKHPSPFVVYAAEKALPIWSPSSSKKYETNKLYRGPLFVPSTGKTVDKSTPLFVGQIVQVMEFGTAWLPAKIQKLLADGQVEVGILMDRRAVRSITVTRRSIQLAPDEVEQPDRPEPSSASKAREWSDSTGKFKLRATLLKQVDGLVYLQTEEGKELKIAFNRLCDADKAFVLDFNGSSENPFMP